MLISKLEIKTFIKLKNNNVKIKLNLKKEINQENSLTWGTKILNFNLTDWYYYYLTKILI